MTDCEGDSGRLIVENKVDVTPGKDGGWIVTNSRAEQRFERKRDAALQGRIMLREHGGGELVIHNLSGKIISRDHVRGKTI